MDAVTIPINEAINGNGRTTARGMTEAFAFLTQVLRWRLRTTLLGEAQEPIPPFQPDPTTQIGQFVLKNQLGPEESLVLLLALVPHVSPGFLGSMLSEFLPEGGEFAEFGGIRGKNHRGIIPTGETALYLLAGNGVEERLRFSGLFTPQSTLIASGILTLGSVAMGEPPLSGAMILDTEVVSWLTMGKVVPPSLSSQFPAQRITTSLTWHDLVLQENTLHQVQEIELWMQYNDTLLQQYGMQDRIKAGYRVMFYGPPGTGKTLTASLLGKYTGKEVYRIDLSLIVSKYIGETEKNLSKLFDKAKNKDWILFFDEADAIFGKRTNVRDAHDKYANQEVSYLLQRIEGHEGLVILASNLKGNIDTAFTRRFQSMVEFQNPGYAERRVLWQNNLPKGLPADPSVDLSQLAETYEITGANIINVIQYAALQTLKEGRATISQESLLAGIQKEYQKEGKLI